MRPTVVEGLRRLARVTSYQHLISTGLAPVGPEDWHEVGEPGEPAFQSGYDNVASSTNPCGYRIDASGFVHLRGYVTVTSSLAGTIFTLPSGYRPARTMPLPVANSGLSMGEINTLYIHADGRVEHDHRGLTSSFVWVALDNHHWRAA